MQKFTSANLWDEIAAIAIKSKVKKAAISYVTTDDEIKFSEGDLLIVDATDHAIKTGQTSAQVLDRALKKKAEIYSCPGLHAKVLLLGGVAVIGSANLSKTSRSRKIEAALISDEPAIVGWASRFVEALKDPRISDRVDKQFIARIKQITVTRRRGDSGKRADVKLGRSAPQTWILGSYEFDRELKEEEKQRVDDAIEAARDEREHSSSTISWIRFGLKSSFPVKAKRGDSIIVISRPSRNSRIESVQRHMPIRRIEKIGQATYAFYEDFRSSKSTALSWKQFLKLSQYAHLSGKIGPTSERVIPEKISRVIADNWNDFRK